MCKLGLDGIILNWGMIFNWLCDMISQQTMIHKKQSYISEYVQINQ